MLTAAVISFDSNSSASLRAGLEQSGMVSVVNEWQVGRIPEASESVPDVILLDVGREAEPFFAIAARLRKLRGTVRLIVVSPTTQPSHQLLIDAMRCGVQDFLSRPIDLQKLQETLLRISQDSHPMEAPASEKLIAVMGAKGGVGTTTIAVNLSVQFASLPGRRAVLLDFARPLGLVPLQLNLQPKFGVRHAVENLDRLDTHFFSGLLTAHKSNLQVLAGASHPEEWQQIPLNSLGRIVNVAQSGFDFVVADVGSDFSPEWNRLLQLCRMVLLVSETDVASLWSLERRFMALSGMGIDPDRVRIVINRWRRGDEEALKLLEKSTKRPPFVCLPNDYRRVNEALNFGAPLERNGSDSMANHLAQLAAQLAGTRETVIKRSSFSSLFNKR